MDQSKQTPERTVPSAADAAQAITRRVPQDVVFAMRFLGESQLLLQDHFRAFIAAELERHAVTRDTHPLLQYFIDSHAMELRDFVFAGVGLSHQFRLHDFERLARDPATIMQMDIWDTLVSHIETAERRFLDEVADLPRLLDRIEGRTP